jgi:hypothetical protein
VLERERFEALTSKTLLLLFSSLSLSLARSLSSLTITAVALDMKEQELIHTKRDLEDALEGKRFLEEEVTSLR